VDTHDIYEAFELMERWEDRYELIGDLGRELLTISDDERTDANLVKGCNTRTWLTGALTNDDPALVEYRADAETPLVRGLVALLLIPFQHHRPEEILATDPGPYIDRLGLAEHLSANRQAGMEHFIARVYQIARAAQADG
jgi:cysteine desulfuration protein SufE